MPKPKTKAELIETSKNNFRKLNELIDSYSYEEKLWDFPKDSLNRNIKDVLAHLHHWNLLFLGWYEVGMRGEKPDMPEKGYTWKTLPELNKKIRDQYKNVEFSEIRGELKRSFAKLHQIIQKHTDKELFEKKKYTWTGTTSLGAYLISASSSHYDWAYKLIKKSKK